MQSRWNNGMVEYWNVGINEEVGHFNAFLSKGILLVPHPVHYKLTLSPIFPEPIIPSFQYSSIPIVPAPHRSRSGEAGGSEAS